MNESQPTLEHIFQISTGAWAAAILGAGVTHSVFTHIAKGTDTAEAIARETRISGRGAEALLDGLVGLGLLTRSERRFRNSPEADEFLVEGKPSYFGGFPKVMLREFSEWASLPDVVRTGKPTTSETADLPENPFWEELVPAIAVLSMPVVQTAAERLRLSDGRPVSILDVGGGSGVYSAVWLGMNPRARATQVDWGNVNRIAREFVGRRGVADRFRTIDGDFHTVELGTAEYDIAVYSHIAHQESPEENVAMFRKFRKALKPGGTLLISDFVVDDDRSGPPFPLIFRSEMLLRTKDGATWRRADYDAWLREAGFERVEFQTTPSPATLVYAT